MDQEQNENNNVNEITEEVSKGIHASKSYVGAAWLTLLLYYIGFYIVGLIVNLNYLSKSKETMRITNTNPPGRGCLKFLVWSHLIIVIIVILMILATVGITTFKLPSTYSNRSAIVGDLNNLASSALAYYKTPTSHGGGNQSWNSIDDIGQWLGYGYNSSTNQLNTSNGSFLLSVNRDILTIVGKDNSNNKIATMTITGATQNIEFKLDK